MHPTHTYDQPKSQKERMCITSQKLLGIIDRIENEVSKLAPNKSRLSELSDKLVPFFRDPIDVNASIIDKINKELAITPKN